MKLVKFDLATGLAIDAVSLPTDVRIVDDDRPVSDAGERLAIVNGAVTRIWDLRGFSAYGGPLGRTPMRVPNDAAYLGKSWTDLQAMTAGGNDYGIRQAPRPETTQEASTRQAAAAQAAAAAERARINALVVSSDKLTQAAFAAGLITAEEAIAWGGSGTIPAPLVTAIATLAPNKRALASIRASTLLAYRRNDPLLEEVWLAIPGVTTQALDALFIAAAAIE